MPGDGADLPEDPIGAESLEEQDGWLVIPATGTVVDDELVRALRDGDQR